MPTTDTRVRPKASGYRHEGSTSQFVILYMTLLYTSMDGAPHSMSCILPPGVSILGVQSFYNDEDSVP